MLKNRGLRAPKITESMIITSNRKNAWFFKIRPATEELFRVCAVPIPLISGLLGCLFVVGHPKRIRDYFFLGDILTNQFSRDLAVLDHQNPVTHGDEFGHFR